MNRRTILALLLLQPFHVRAQDIIEQSGTTSGQLTLPQILDRAGELETLKTVLVARDGILLAERGYRGNRVTTPTNIKSASKTIISALVGIAIDKGLLSGPDQKIAPLLRADLPANPDPRLENITIGNLLSMQSGLEPTSGPNYGRWTGSRNWVRAVLARPFIDEPGGRMLYSTGSTHLLSAILTYRSGRSTHELAQEWLEPLPDFTIGGWARDPQGIYFGGNQMAMSAKSLLAFGELYRNGGRTPDSQQLLSPEWIAASWQQRTTSEFNGDGYGYGWFLRNIGGQDVKYAWGYGGQMLYIVPALGLTVVMTSEEDNPSARNGYRDALHDLLADIIATQTPSQASD